MPIKMKLNATVLNPDSIEKKYSDRKRVGKTARDKTTGSWQSRFANREARVAWQHDPRRTGASHPSNKQ